MKNYGIQVTRDIEHSHRSNASDQFFQPIFAQHTGQSIGQDAFEHHRSTFTEEQMGASGLGCQNH
jgi:hypothetical protein